MDKMTENLKDWAKHFLKSKDLIKREIASIVPGDADNKIQINYSEKNPLGKRECWVYPNLPEELLLENHITLIVLNTKENFDWMISRWGKLSTFDDLNIYFVNPDLQIDNKWVIYPHTHSKICDKESFKQGLVSLFESVPAYGHARP